MAISYNKVDIRGNALEPIFEEILFQNPTINEGLVDFRDKIKAGTIITDNLNSVQMQAYTTGTPTSSGTMSFNDVEVTPVKVMFYNTFETDSLRPTRFNSSMPDGAWNTMSTDFEKLVMSNISKSISNDAEKKFWKGITSTTKSAVATAGTASYTSRELSYVSSSDVSFFDGILTKLITSTSTVKVAGTTITTSNINDEYKKLYQAILPVVLNSDEQPFIYAPYSHKQLINVFNISATYRDLFQVDINSNKYFYSGVEIKFLPFPENVMIVDRKSNLLWLTDLMSDINNIQVDKVSNPSDQLFYKVVFTELAHVAQPQYSVLYI
jgi:hypothetical protein